MDDPEEWGRKARAVLPNGLPRYQAVMVKSPNGGVVTEWVESPAAAYFD